jgi:hypothetical protein
MRRTADLAVFDAFRRNEHPIPHRPPSAAIADTTAVTNRCATRLDRLESFVKKRVSNRVKDEYGHELRQMPEVVRERVRLKPLGAVFRSPGKSVEAVRKDAGVKDLALVGHSMGTPVMRQYYRAHPKRTRAMVEVDGSLEQFIKTAEIDKYIAQFTGADYRDNLGKAIDGMFGRNTPAAMCAAIKKAMLSTPHHVVVSVLKGLLDPAIYMEGQVSVPLLAVCAKLPWWPADYKEYVRKLAPKVEYHVMDDAGHFLMLDRPGEFNALLTAFLGRQKILKP